ncbi:MAG: 50S ribosomal protein L10 [Planctomycetes bacterium]|nr:50S ribosomal protein L10 [Planctomycetota bacterium]
MPSILNQLIYKETRNVFESSTAVIFIDYQSFVQADAVAIRDEATKVGGTARVVKNSISSIVLKDLGYEATEAILKGQVVALCGEDAVALAKVAADFAKKNKKGEALGGIVDGAVISAADVATLSKLPSKDQLVGMFVNVVAAPLRGFVTVLNGNIKGLAVALNAIKEKKEKEAA